ncbi:hypothetical protein V5D56_07235 [Cellulosimicrobium sp. PMB13]|uniref:hypothetical protein n=1 Tax=Cellulosimicrobium sp. PMB13 TaxID=3120158 RepID=UPI003F4C88E6
MRPSPADRPAGGRDRRPRHHRERDAYRFVEVVPDARRSLLDGLASASAALLVGTVLGFLVLLGLTLAGGELVVGARHEAEEILRTTIGWWVLVLVAAVLAHVPLRAAATLALGPALLGPDRPRTDVPTRSTRRRVRESNPPGALAGLAWTFLASAMLAGGVIAPFAMDDDDTARLPTIVVSAIVGTTSVVTLGIVPGLRARWAAVQEAVRSTWGPNEARLAEAAEKRRRAALATGPTSRPSGRRAARNGRAAAVLGGTGMAGLVLFMAGTIMRHPQKFGPDRYYGPVGETAIDVLVGAGAVLVGSALLLGAAWLAGPGLRQDRRRRDALAALGSPDGFPTASTPPADDVVEELLAPWTVPATLALVWLVGVGLVAPSLLAGAAGEGVALVADGVPWVVVALTALVTAVGAAVVVVRDVPRSAAVRAAVRERWHPGDVDPA